MDSIYLLDHAFAPLCLPIDGYFSLVWSLSYQTCGTFAALLPYDGAGIWEEAVYLTDGVRCGRIERIEIENGRVRLTGRTLECLLYDRLFAEKFEYTGTLSEACLTAVRTCCADLPLTVETDGASFPQTGIYRAQWTTVGQFLHETLSQAGGSFAVEYVPGAPKCAFRLLCGTDRSAAGAIFSEDFGNIASLMVERDRSDRVDRVYVTGADRVTVSVVREGAEAPYRDARIEAADMESGAVARITRCSRITRMPCAKGDGHILRHTAGRSCVWTVVRSRIRCRHTVWIMRSATCARCGRRHTAERCGSRRSIWFRKTVCGACTRISGSVGGRYGTRCGKDNTEKGEYICRKS